MSKNLHMLWVFALLLFGLTASSSDNREIVVLVDKKDNYLIVKRGQTVLFIFRTSCGDATPAGKFQIISKKHTNPKGELGSHFLGINSYHRRTGRQFGIHGTNRPDLIGKSVSRGCVRLTNKDVALLYSVVNIGTPVIIKNDFPDIPPRQWSQEPLKSASNLKEAKKKETRKIHWQIAGYSVERRPIHYAVFGEGTNVTLVLGGIHGDEPNTVELVDQLARYLSVNPKCLRNAKVVLVRCVNPDGRAKRQRTNARGVDINRNFPTKDWNLGRKSGRYNRGVAPESEPETRIIVQLIRRYRPSKIISIHAPLHQINYDGPAARLAAVMAKYNGYRVTSDIGYPTPGSLGTYAGKERKIPVITLELPNDPFETIWKQNKDALLAAIRFEINSTKPMQ